MSDKLKTTSHVGALFSYAHAQTFIYHTSRPVTEVAETLKAIKSGGMFSQVDQAINLSPDNEGVGFIGWRGSKSYSASVVGHIETDAMGQTVIRGRADIPRRDYITTILTTNGLFLLVIVGMCNEFKAWICLPFLLFLLANADLMWLAVFTNCRDTLLSEIEEALKSIDPSLEGQSTNAIQPEDEKIPG